jgi:hypothetical protein
MLGRTGDIAALAVPAETALVTMPVSPVTSAQAAHVKGDVMAEHHDVALVRRGYAAFSAGDVATLSELLAEDARQYQPAWIFPVV